MSDWDRCRGWIESARTDWSFEEIKAGGERGFFYLFEHLEGCMVGEFIVSPRHRALHVFAAGGTLKAMDDLGPVAEAFGARHGCNMVSATGRKGWLRYSQRHGYKPGEPVIWKEI